jgi:hypothetical protein
MNSTKLRKTLGLSVSKLLVSVSLILTPAAVMAPVAHAVNLGDAQLAQADETANAGTALGAANVTTAINLSFSGKSQTGSPVTSTGAYVTISATAMTFYQPFGTVDATVGSAGVITYASTLSSNQTGSLCDYINGLGKSYRCLLVGAKRDDPPGVVLKTQTSTDLTNNLAAIGGLSVLNTTSTYVSLGITPAVGRRVVLKQCVVNGQASGTDNFVYVYGQLRKYGAIASPNAVDPYGTVADDTYLVWQSSTVQNTNATVPSSNALPRWIEFAQGAHVVVRVSKSGSGGGAIQTGSNFIDCSWDER